MPAESEVTAPLTGRLGFGGEEPPPRDLRRRADRLESAGQTRMFPAIGAGAAMSTGFPSGDAERSALQAEVDALNRRQVGSPAGSGLRDAWGAAAALGQGGTWGFSDEIGSGIGAAYDAVTGKAPFGEAYRSRMDANERLMGGFREERPWLSTGLEMAGTVPSSMALFGGLTRGLPRAGAAATGALQGGAEGAAYGAGIAPDAASMRQQAGMYGAMGMGMGAAAAPAAAGGKRLFDWWRAR